MAKIRSRDPVAQKRPLLDTRAKELMMVVLLRNTKVFTTYQQHLRATYFNNQEVVYAVLWTALERCFNRLGRLPDKGLLYVEVETLCNESPGLLNANECDELAEVIEYAYNAANFQTPVTDDPGWTDWGIETVRLFLLERWAIGIRSIGEVDNTVGTESALNTDAQAMINQLAVISTLGRMADRDSYSAGWAAEETVEMFPTGISFIDEYMGGGHVCGELYGLMGPFGSCKSTIAYMLAGNAVNLFHTQHRENPQSPRKVVFVVSYEDPLRVMQKRTLGYVAQIPREVMDSLRDEETDLLRAPNYRDYERELFATDFRASRPVPGEYERVTDAIAKLNAHTCYLDMTGISRPGVGGGYIPEIANLISAYLQTHPGTACGLVVIDYVGAAAKRHIAAKGLSNDDLRHLVGGAALAAKTSIATKFKCPIWMLHQLKGQANKMGEGRLADYADSAECSSFAENFDYMFIIGQPNRTFNAAQFGCGKCRRSAPRAATVILIDGRMYRVQPGNALYAIDTNQHRIIRREDASRVNQLIPQAVPRADESPSPPSVQRRRIVSQLNPNASIGG
jgi:RecA/RadA recombinase